MTFQLISVDNRTPFFHTAAGAISICTSPFLSSKYPDFNLSTKRFKKKALGRMWRRAAWRRDVLAAHYLKNADPK